MSHSVCDLQCLSDDKPEVYTGIKTMQDILCLIVTLINTVY